MVNNSAPFIASLLKQTISAIPERRGSWSWQI